MLRVGLVLIVALFSICARASDEVDSVRQLSKNIVYLEIGGIGGAASVNYERLYFPEENIAVGGSIGISTFTITDFKNRFNPDIIVPVSMTGMWGNTHYMEIGTGITLQSMVVADSDLEVSRKLEPYWTNTIGYRYQPNPKGFVYRLVYSPFINAFGKYFHWGGMSFGYAF